MTPRLEIQLDGEPDESAWADLLRRVPVDRRVRLVVTGSADGEPPVWTLRRAADAGFVRVRWAVPLGKIRPDAIDLAVAAGAIELELDANQGPWTQIASHREAGRLVLVRLRTNTDRPPTGNPCKADELVINAAGMESAAADADAVLASVGHAFPRVAVHGAPLCDLPRLDPKKVLANALVARLEADGFGLVLPFDEPGLTYFAPCGSCALALACDGSQILGRPQKIRAFPDGPEVDVPPGPSSVAMRRHPPGFLTGKIHVLAVLAGVRPCGRLALPVEGVARSLAVLSRLGLRTTVVDVGQVPDDRDTARDPAGEMAHVFFSRDGSASRAADLERRFCAAESSGAPMGADTFSRTLGSILGYPACCVDAFLTAGPGVATDDLIRAAHGRSERFHWALNHLDARSTFPLIAHIPCRYDCQASITQALRLHGILDVLFPFLGATARRVLGRPLLFVDGNRIAALDGAVDADGLGLTCVSVDPLGFRGAGELPTDGSWGRILSSLALPGHVRLNDGGLGVERPDGTREFLPVVPAPFLFPFGADRTVG